jgi:hypothetical protein
MLVQHQSKRAQSVQAWAPTLKRGSIIRQSQFGNGHFGGLHEGNHFTAHLQFQFPHGTGGDHRGDDAGSGLHVDFRQYVADDDFLDLPLNWLRTLMALMVMVFLLMVH